MALKTDEELKAFFEEGDFPDQQDFTDFIDSKWSKSQYIPIQQITIGEIELVCAPTTVWDMSTGLNAFLHIDQDTTIDIQNMQNGQHAIIIIVQDGVGGHTFTLPAGHKVGDDGEGEILLSTAANSEDTLSVYKSSLGYYWVSNKTFTAAP